MSTDDFGMFLAEQPPDATAQIDLPVMDGTRLRLFPIQLFCADDLCGRIQVFEPKDDFVERVYLGVVVERFVGYCCRNCRRSEKRYAVIIIRPRTGDTPTVIKLGESPPFGPPVSPKLITLIGGDRELFLKGRRAENHGLGIGAFGYYRRVVENIKTRLFDRMIRVSSELGAAPEEISALEAAKRETQFSKAVDSLKELIPSALRIKGHNPLKLLHSALSVGIHEQDDAECLKRAHDIRTVLTELAERMARLLKDNDALNTSLSRLISPAKKKALSSP